VNSLLRINSQQIVTASNDTTIKVWNMASGSLACSTTLYNHSGPVNTIVALPNGYLASGSCDNTIKIWDLLAGQLISTLTGHTGCVNDLKYNPFIGSTGSLISGSSDMSVIVWDLSSWFMNVKTLTTSSAINSLLIMPSGTIVAGSNMISFWSTAYSLWPNSAAPSTILSMILLNDGVTIACGMSDSTIRLYSTSSGSFTGVSLTGHTLAVNSIDLLLLPASANNLPFIISGSADGYVKIWNLKTNTLVKSINIGTAVKSVAYLYSDTGISDDFEFKLKNCGETKENFILLNIIL
jgi:WD40 repeat protein